MRFWLLVADDCADRDFGVEETADYIARVEAFTERVTRHVAGVTEYLRDARTWRP